MAKFLNIPVTGEQSQLVSADNVKLVEQASSTRVIISYGDGTRVSLTHAGIAAGAETMRDQIEDSIQAIQRKKWSETTEAIVPVAAVSGVAITLIT